MEWTLWQRWGQHPWFTKRLPMTYWLWKEVALVSQCQHLLSSSLGLGPRTAAAQIIGSKVAGMPGKEDTQHFYLCFKPQLNVTCYGLNVCVSPNLHVGVLTLEVMVLGGKALD